MVSEAAMAWLEGLSLRGNLAALLAHLSRNDLALRICSPPSAPQAKSNGVSDLQTHRHLQSTI